MQIEKKILDLASYPWESHLFPEGIWLYIYNIMRHGL